MAAVLEQRLGHVRCAVEAVYHRHNVSAILRTCDALGIHRVHLVGAPGREVSRGAARGAERWLELRAHADPAEAIGAIRAAGCRLYVADLGEASVTPEEVPLDRPVCLWFGAELVGVSEAARAAADGVVTVPMRGMAQSLNVSVAAALSLRPVAERARALPEARLSRDEVEATLDRWLDRDQLQREGADLRRRIGTQ
jgi:tRNA (guanosine-2'-O-)-methyltransferase